MNSTTMNQHGVVVPTKSSSWFERLNLFVLARNVTLFRFDEDGLIASRSLEILLDGALV